MLSVVRKIELTTCGQVRVCGDCDRGGAGRAAAHCGVYDVELCHAGHGPRGQLGGQEVGRWGCYDELL
jgi:hypothetical protein